MQLTTIQLTRYLSQIVALLMNELRRNDVEVHTNAGFKKKPEVAIVILNWNGLDHLKKFLPFVLQSGYENKRVIVADNHSDDGSVMHLSEHFPDVEIIENAVNKGFAAGYNMALRQVKADYYVLLNSDVEVTENWISPIIDLMEGDSNIAASQPRILSYHQRNYFEYAGAGGGWIDSFGYPFARGRVFDTCEKDLGQYNDAQPCFWASGAAFFIRSDVFHEMGGFDEYFFAHQEEIDLCWRLQNAGYLIYVQPASVVYHVGGGTLPTGNSRKTFFNFRNNLVMVHKNFSPFEKVWKLPFRIFLNGIALLKGMPKQPGYRSAIVTAHLEYLRWAVKRKKNMPLQKRKSYNGVYNGLIVWDYYVKGKKTFSEIVQG